MAERVGLDLEEEQVRPPRSPRPSGLEDTTDDRRAGRCARRPAAEAREVVLPEDCVGRQTHRRQVELFFHVPDHTRQQRIWCRRPEDRIAVTPAQGGAASIEAVGGSNRRSEHRYLRTQLLGEGASHPREVALNKPTMGGLHEEFREVDVHHLPARVDASVRTPGTDKLDLHTTHLGERPCELTADGALLGLPSKAPEVGAVVGDLQHDAEKRPYAGRFIFAIVLAR